MFFFSICKKACLRFSLAKGIITSDKNCLTLKSLSGETIVIFRNGSPVRIVKFPL